MSTETYTQLHYATAHPVIITKLRCLFNVQHAFLWGVLLLLLLLLLSCVKVSPLHSVCGGRNRVDHDPANRGGSENKQWKHGHGQNPAGAGAEVPPGHLWDRADPWGHRMEPDITTAVNKCRHCSSSSSSSQARPWTLMLNSAGGQFSCLFVRLFSAVFNTRECGESGWEREETEVILASPDTASCTPNSDLHGNYIRDFF